MYNEKQKRDFLSSYSKSETGLRAYESVFNSFQKHEEEWGADLCTKSKEELEPIVNNILGVRVQGKVSRLAVCKAYVRWCLKNNVKGACDGMLHVDITDFGKIKDRMVCSPMHLQKYLNEVFHKESEKTIDDVYRCYLWLAFAGMSEEQIFNVASDEVDITNMVVMHEGKEYTIYRESLQAFKNCVELDCFVYFHPNYSKEITRQRVPGNQLLRGIKSNAKPVLTRVELSKKTKEAVAERKTTTRLSYYRAWLSGVFYRKYEQELVGEEPTFSDIASDFMRGKTYKLSSGRNLPSAKHRRVVKEYNTDYQNWKKAFFS